MDCPRCNHNNADAAKFCSNCGMYLISPPPAMPAAAGRRPGVEPPAAPVIPGFARQIEAAEGTEVLLAAAAANGVEKIFFNGGTDNFHFMEHVARFKALKRPTPDIVMTTHEHTGLCAAMGYFQYTHKPQLLVLHVALGTMQPGGAWEEAWKSRAGVVVLAGTPGQTTKNELGYTTRNGIQFTQEIYAQEAMLGSYAKWNYKIERIENAALIMNRAFQMASAEPCGVSYLTYPMEVALAPLTSGLVYDPADFAAPDPGEGDSAALKEAARLLVNAKNPVVMVKGMGRHPEAVPHLVELVEKLALPLASNDKYMNFPRQHWAHAQQPAVNTRDVILLIDNDVPWTTPDPPKTARIISMDADPLQSRCPMNGTPVHVPITCNSAKALPVLSRMCDELITAERRSAFAARRKQLEAARAAAGEAFRAAIEKGKTEFPLNRDWISECIRNVADENTVLLWDIGGIGSQSDRSQPGSVFQMWGASLGSSWARSIGVKLAAPEKTVIASGGDGCALYSEPISCLQLARQARAPVLYCVSNNHRHNAVQMGLTRYGAESYSAMSGYVGSAISPSPDFAGIARAVGAYGEKVTRPDQVEPALQRALTAMKDGQAAVLDFVTVKE